MVAQMTICTSYPLPPNLPPQTVLDALHRSYEPLIKANPYLRGFTRRRLSVSEVVDDPFFRVDGRKLEAYEVHDRIPLIPVAGLHRDITIPAVFQSYDKGVRCRADAPGGVRVWSEYEVRRQKGPAQLQQKDSDHHLPSKEDRKSRSRKTSPTPPSNGWELHETAVVTCSALMKPFVRGSFETGHREVLKGTVEEILKENQPAIAS